MPQSDFIVNLETFESDIAQQILEELDPDMFELDLSTLSLKIDYSINVEINSIKVVNAESESGYKTKKKIPR